MVCGLYQDAMEWKATFVPETLEVCSFLWRKSSILLQIKAQYHIHASFSESKTCFTGSVRFGDMCYKVKAAPLPGFDARQTCMDMGGDLISIGTDTEQMFVIDYLSRNGYDSDYWIGQYQIIDICRILQGYSFLVKFRGNGNCK